MKGKRDKIVCESPTPGKQSTNIDRWKYDIISKAILKVLPAKGEGIPFKELPDLVLSKISEEKRDEIGSIGWYTTTVKLDLECKGKIERVSASSPQRLRKK